MTAHAGTSQLLALAVVFLSLLTTPPLLEAVQCPRDSVSVNNGSLMFRPLSPGTANTDPNYDPGAIGGWYSLASGFVDVVRSGSLPYNQIENQLNALNVPCSVFPDSQECTTAAPDSGGDGFDPLQLVRSFGTWWAGIIAVTIFGGLLAFSFLICGCCFWCCRCCGNCGGGKTQKISDNMDCKSFTFTIILLLFTLLLLVGVIFAFFSNEQTFRSLENFQESINEVAGTGVNYVNDTITELEELLCQLAAPMNSVVTTVVDQARGFNTTLESEIAQLGDEIFGILTDLETLTAGINTTGDILLSVNSSTMALIMSFMRLEDSLVNVRSDISTLMTNCSTVANAGTGAQQIENVCNMIPLPSDFDTDADLNNLPDITSQLQMIQDSIRTVNLNQLIEEGRQQFDNISQVITTTVDDNLIGVVTQIENVTNTALDGVGNITQAIRVLLNTSQDKAQCPPIGQAFNNLNLNLEDFIPAGSSGLDLSIGQRRRRQADTSPAVVLNVGYIQECIVNQGFDFVRRYDIYRYAFGIVICSVSLVTIVFVLIGVLFGMIGFRKNVDPSERSGLSHCGGILLLVGVGLTFLFGFLLLIFSGIIFFFGANAQKLCQALEGPEYPLFSEFIDDQEFWGGSLGGQLFLQVNPSADNPILSISVALRNCRDDQALYSAFNLSNLIPTGNISSQIQTLVNFSQFENLVDGLIEGAADSFNFNDNSFLPEEARSALNGFVDANVSNINISDFTDRLNAALLSFDIDQSIDQLNNISMSLRMLSQSTLADQVNSITSILVDIRDNQIPDIQNQTATLSNDVMQLETNINTTVMNVSRVFATTEDLIANITGQALSGFLNDSVRTAISQTVGYLNDYLAHMDTAIARDVSRCQPLWAIYTTIHNSVCGMFLDGLNGFWWSLGFCSVLFIPVIILSVITSTCYLRKKLEEPIDSYTDYPMKDVR